MAARYSTLDLNDATVTGGNAHAITVGLNWYLRRNLRLMFNYTDIGGRNRDLERDTPELFQFRALVFF